jgi:hypothetical protein
MPQERKDLTFPIPPGYHTHTAEKSDADIMGPLEDIVYFKR